MDSQCCESCGNPLDYNEPTSYYLCAHSGCENEGRIVSQSELIGTQSFYNGRPEGRLTEGQPTVEGHISEATKTKAEGDLRRIADRLKVKPLVLEHASCLLQTRALGLCTGEHGITSEFVAGAVLCAEARRDNFPLYASDVARELNLDPRKFAAILSSVLAILDLRNLAKTPEESERQENELRDKYLEKGVRELVPDPALQMKILEDARLILRWAAVKGSPEWCTVALRNLGPAVQIAAQGQQVVLRNEEIAEKFRQTTTSLVDISHKMRSGLVKVADKLPWTNGQLDIKKVPQFAPSLATTGYLLSVVQEM